MSCLTAFLLVGFVRWRGFLMLLGLGLMILLGSSGCATSGRGLLAYHRMIITLKIVIFTVDWRSGGSTAGWSSMWEWFFGRWLDAVFLVDQIAAQVARSHAFLEHIMGIEFTFFKWFIKHPIIKLQWILFQIYPSITVSSECEYRTVSELIFTQTRKH